MHEVAVAVAGAADQVRGIEHRAAQAIEHRGGVIVDLAVVRDAEVELDAMQARQIDEQARQRAIAMEDRGDLVHALLVRAEPIDLGLAHAAERPAATAPPGRAVARREEVDAAGATALGAAQRGLGGGEQALGIGGVLGQARDADRQRQLAVARHRRRGDRIAQPRGLRQRARLRGLGQEQHELLAGVARDDVGACGRDRAIRPPAA